MSSSHERSNIDTCQLTSYALWSCFIVLLSLSLFLFSFCVYEFVVVLFVMFRVCVFLFYCRIMSYVVCFYYGFVFVLLVSYLMIPVVSLMFYGFFNSLFAHVLVPCLFFICLIINLVFRSLMLFRDGCVCTPSNDSIFCLFYLHVCTQVPGTR